MPPALLVGAVEGSTCLGLMFRMFGCLPSNAGGRDLCIATVVIQPDPAVQEEFCRRASLSISFVAYQLSPGSWKGIRCEISCGFKGRLLKHSIRTSHLLNLGCNVPRAEDKLRNPNRIALCQDRIQRIHSALAVNWTKAHTAKPLAQHLFPLDSPLGFRHGHENARHKKGPGTLRLREAEGSSINSPVLSEVELDSLERADHRCCQAYGLLGHLGAALFFSRLLPCY